jgi:hypothetical protein
LRYSIYLLSTDQVHAVVLLSLLSPDPIVAITPVGDEDPGGIRIEKAGLEEYTKEQSIALSRKSPNIHTGEKESKEQIRGVLGRNISTTAD